MTCQCLEAATAWSPAVAAVGALIVAFSFLSLRLMTRMRHAERVGVIRWCVDWPGYARANSVRLACNCADQSTGLSAADTHRGQGGARSRRAAGRVGVDRPRIVAPTPRA